jgi:hypothetical protein
LTSSSRFFASNCLCRWEVVFPQCLETGHLEWATYVDNANHKPINGTGGLRIYCRRKRRRSCIHSLRGTCGCRCRCDSSALLARRHDEVSWTPRSTNVTMAQAQVLLSSHTDRAQGEWQTGVSFSIIDVSLFQFSIACVSRECCNGGQGSSLPGTWLIPQHRYM